MNISYPLIMQESSLFGKVGVLWFLVKPVLSIALLPYYRRNITLFHCFPVFHSNCRVTEKKWNTNKNLSCESGRRVSEKYLNIILVIWFDFVIINAIILLMTQHFWTLKSMLLKGRYNYYKINYKKWNTHTHTHTRVHTHTHTHTSEQNWQHFQDSF